MRKAKVDTNQKEITAALRRAGCTVQPLHTVGRGVPDLLVGFRGQNFLLELKDGSKRPSERKLTDDQQEWHQQWRGQVAVVESVDEALRLIAQ
jgi:hypothetical protein